MNDQLLSSNKPTIIIAAYNEATVIRKTLELLTNDDDSANYQILVVCNGCTDNTEEIIIDEFSNVHCHSLAKPSKALAIRYAESLTPGFPRLYLDADIELLACDAAWIIDYARKQGSPTLVIPGSNILDDHCQPLVKSFYRAWYNTEHVQQSGYGAGAYLLNQTARNRFGEWPELIADDGFIRSQFNTEEIFLAQLCKVNVKAPRTLATLIKVKARVKLGNLELKNHLNRIAAPQNNKTVQSRKIDKTGSHHLWYDRVTYLIVNIAAFTLAKWQYLIGKKTWHRDNSNR